MNFKVLIIGDGFIGKNLFAHFAPRHMTHISSRKHMNLLDEDSIHRFFYKKSYTHIIVASGIKNIRECEDNPEECMKVNADSVNHIIGASSSSKIIYISTDYVFDGEKGFYTTKDFTNPITAYGVSKLKGEQYTLTSPKNLVVRTSGVYGEGCIWYENLIKDTDEGKPITAFQDIYNSATDVKELASDIELCMIGDYNGVVHLCGNRTNRYDLYRKICVGKEHLIQKGRSNGMFPKDISLISSLN